MTDLEKLNKMLEDDKVKYGLSLTKDLHKKLALGQTRYLWRYGTLSDGHDKVTPAAKYFQAIKEIYTLTQSLVEHRCVAMEAYADELEAVEALEKAVTESQKLRADARIIRAKASIQNRLFQAEEALKGIDECNKVRLELEPEVEAKYPEGIEQASFDMWKAVAEFKLMRERTPGMGRENLNHVPLPPEIKAAMGIAYDRPDMVAPLMIERQEEIAKLPSQSVNEYLGITQESNQSEVKQ